MGLRFHLLDLVLSVAVVALLLAGRLVGVLVVHGDAVHVLAAGLALELVPQQVGAPAAAHHVVAALRRRRRDLVQQMMLLQRLLELRVVVQQVWLPSRKGKNSIIRQSTSLYFSTNQLKLIHHKC